MLSMASKFFGKFLFPQRLELMFCTSIHTLHAIRIRFPYQRLITGILQKIEPAVAFKNIFRNFSINLLIGDKIRLL